MDALYPIINLFNKII